MCRPCLDSVNATSALYSYVTLCNLLNLSEPVSFLYETEIITSFTSGVPGGTDTTSELMALKTTIIER